MAADSAVLWTPSAERVAACQLTAFRAAVAARHGLELPDYAALHAWSLAQREEFWREVWALGKVLGHGPLDRVLVNDVMPGAKWFPDTRLNYAVRLTALSPLPLISSYKPESPCADRRTACAAAMRRCRPSSPRSRARTGVRFRGGSFTRRWRA